MKLFGFIEFLYIQSIFPLSSPIHVLPYNLFDVLEEYRENKNLSIGLQSESSNKILNIPPLEFHKPEVFLEVYSYFNDLGRKIHFLMPREHFESIASIASEMLKIEKKLEGDDKKNLELEFHKLEVKYNYMRAIGVNESILRNISLFKPDLVFMGDGHARLFYMNRHKIKEEYGIEIDEYWRDRILEEPTEDDLMFVAASSSESLSMGDILGGMVKVVSEKVDCKDLIEQDLETVLIQRNYDAVNKGRVTEGNPHFIGTWDLDIEPRGLFEVYVDEVKLKNGVCFISGGIEDCIGSALFEGRLDSNGIRFNKFYNPSRSIGGYPKKMLYEGNLTNDEFYGEYDHDGSIKRFKMKQLKEVA